MTDWFPIGITEPPHSLGVYCHQRKITTLLIFILKNILYIYFQRGRREGETEGEKHPCVVASHMPLNGDLAHHPGMCPDWEWNHWPFGVQAHAQSTELHQPGHFCYFLFSSFLAVVQSISKEEMILTIWPREESWVSLDWEVAWGKIILLPRNSWLKKSVEEKKTEGEAKTPLDRNGKSAHYEWV